jgi:hypothetical protein
MKHIAALIRKGHTRVIESPDDWLHIEGQTNIGCALGMAIAGKYGAEAAHEAMLDGLVKHKGHTLKVIAEMLDIPVSVASEISGLHIQGMSAMKIAEYLESDPVIN